MFTADPDAKNGWQGGFDLVLGNPPWDTLSPDRKEFFSTYQPDIRVRKKVRPGRAWWPSFCEIPRSPTRWDEYRRDLYASVHFMKDSGRYRLFAPGNLGKGDFNVYRMFVETAMQLTRRGGFAAQIVPGGFYGGANASAIRRELYENWDLRLVLGFINTTATLVRRRSTVTQVSRYTSPARHEHARVRGCVRAAIKGRACASARLAQQPRLTVADIREQSPDALAIPEVTGAGDAEIAARMSGRWPLFGDQAAGPPIQHYQRELDMGNDRDLFGDLSRRPAGLRGTDGRPVRPPSQGIPLGPRPIRSLGAPPVWRSA